MATRSEVKNDGGRTAIFWNKMSVYPLEMTVSMLTMVLVATMLSYALFALFNYIYEPETATLGYGALWFAASSIVWLPVAFVFYVRSRGYMQQHPDVVNHPVQRVFVIIYQVVMLLTVIGLSVAAVYTLLTAFVEVGNVGSTLMRTTLPALLSALIFAAAFVAYFRSPVVSRKTFGIGMIVASVLLIIPLAVYSVISLRSANLDKPKVNDLYSLKSSVQNYYSENQKLPVTLKELNTLGLKQPLSDYEYRAKAGRIYELCTTFARENKNQNARRYTSLYQSFDQHGAGRQCFTLNASSYSYDYDYEYRY